MRWLAQVAIASVVGEAASIAVRRAADRWLPKVPDHWDKDELAKLGLVPVCCKCGDEKCSGFALVKKDAVP